MNEEMNYKLINVLLEQKEKEIQKLQNIVHDLHQGLCELETRLDQLYTDREMGAGA